MEETEVQKIVNKNRLSISRLPSWAKEYILNRSRDEFCNDYGQCVASMVKECGEYALLKANFLNGKIYNEKTIQEDEGKIKFGNGKLKGRCTSK